MVSYTSPVRLPQPRHHPTTPHQGRPVRLEQRHRPRILTLIPHHIIHSSRERSLVSNMEIRRGTDSIPGAECSRIAEVVLLDIHAAIASNCRHNGHMSGPTSPSLVGTPPCDRTHLRSCVDAPASTFRSRAPFVGIAEMNGHTVRPVHIVAEHPRCRSSPTLLVEAPSSERRTLSVIEPPVVHQGVQGSIPQSGRVVVAASCGD